jgi:hypothetical protein
MLAFCRRAAIATEEKTATLKDCVGTHRRNARKVIQAALFNKAMHRRGLFKCCLHDVGEFGFGFHGCISRIFSSIMVG